MNQTCRRVLPGLPLTQVFDVVRDIERYPEFVPGCLGARIVARSGNTWIVDNVFGLGPVTSRFFTTATIDAPRALDVHSSEGPWRHFEMNWRFRATDAGCEVSCTTAYELRSRVLSRIARIGMQPAQAAVIEAFINRVTTLNVQRG